jgi:flagellar basal body rod protein FlgG
MIRGFYSAASSLVAGLFRQELISHNLANIDVAGYKETGTTLGEFDHIFLQR